MRPRPELQGAREREWESERTRSKQVIRRKAWNAQKNEKKYLQGYCYNCQKWPWEYILVGKIIFLITFPYFNFFLPFWGELRFENAEPTWQAGFTLKRGRKRKKFFFRVTKEGHCLLAYKRLADLLVFFSSSSSSSSPSAYSNLPGNVISIVDEQ